MNRKFHQRFNIEVNSDEARERFINRTYNLLFQSFYNSKNSTVRNNIYQNVAAKLGIEYKYGLTYQDYVQGDFYNSLQAIEAVWDLFKKETAVFTINEIIDKLFELTEVNIGVKWQEGYFIKTGAKELDETLVNDSLLWLEAKEYKTVQTPFEKSLRHLLEAEKDPSKLSDVITDAYEAIEALSKIVNNNDKDLSANHEEFIKNVKASDEYKKILKEYIVYANKFRHAIKEGKKKPNISLSEAESFVYLTGLFIRLSSHT